MLGWMLKRGTNTAPEREDADDTLADQPDTPAPVFAARAFKSALFGTPAAYRDAPQPKQLDIEPTKDEPSRTPPPKPQGILLTPGTATQRQKRVSFGRDIEANKSKPMTNPLATRKQSQTAPKTDPTDEKQRDKDGNREKASGSDDEWEEEDDEVGGVQCGHDITIDLNEPHSQSGKYWKEEFARYHDDAKAEMEKLLKYKQLAKSYARQKDAEAVELARMLKDEQQKVINMEKKIAQNASHIISQHENNPEDASPELVDKLAKQTALAVQYRQRVQELEIQLQLGPEGNQEGSEFKGRRRIMASPNTQRTLLETQRELRRARAQTKEMGGLREQVSSLKQQLRVAERRAAKAEQQQAETAETASSKELRRQLREAKDDYEKRTGELEQLRKAFDVFRHESEAKEEDTKAVIDRLQAKMVELKKELRHSKAAAPKEASRSKGRHISTMDPDQEAKEVEEPRIEVNMPTKEQTLEPQRLATGDEGLTEVKAPNGRSRTLRQKFKEDTAEDTAITLNPALQPRMSGALGDRPDLKAAKWQPFVPRSPRNRAYLSQELQKRISNGGATPAATRTTSIEAGDLTALAKSISLSDKTRSRPASGAKVDLLQDQFARIGATSRAEQTQDTLVGNASKIVLPPERQAAAEARIQRRRAEKQRLRALNGLDKENVRP